MFHTFWFIAGLPLLEEGGGSQKFVSPGPKPALGGRAYIRYLLKWAVLWNTMQAIFKINW
jgi:hypothetical protein